MASPGVLRLVARGLTYTQIAQELVLSEKTVVFLPIPPDLCRRLASHRLRRFPMTEAVLGEYTSTMNEGLTSLTCR
jgi:FixJ family two-component response regulator